MSRLGMDVRWLERHKGQQSQHENRAEICCSSIHVAQVLVFAGYLMGKPMDLHFTAFEIVAIVLAVTIVSRQTSDGESHWMKGVMLIAVYLMLAIGFFFLPA